MTKYVKKIFFDAIDNEIVADIKSQSNFNVPSFFSICVPRPIILKNFAQNFFFLTHISILFLFILWPVIGFASIITQYLTLWRASKGQNRAPSHGVQINASRISRNNSKRLPLRLHPEIEINFEQYPQTEDSTEHNEINLLELANNKDLAFALRCSISAHFSAPFYHLKYSQWLYTYWAFRWFLTWSILNRSLSQASFIIFSNTHDRWAVLLDALDIPAERIMLQHGQFPTSITFPYKMKKCARFILLWDEGKEYVVHSILDQANSSTIIETIPSAIHFTNVPNADNSMLVILGMAPYQEIKIILRQLHKSYPSHHFYIKPHPSYPRSQKAFSENDHITIWHKKDLPECSLVLSPLSTLGQECEDSGKDVIYYHNKSNSDLMGEISAHLPSYSD